MSDDAVVALNAADSLIKAKPGRDDRHAVHALRRGRLT
jgi:hypothetical protein